MDWNIRKNFYGSEIENLKEGKIMDAFILWGIGLFFIVMGILAIKNSSKCNTKIRAVYVDYAVIKVRNGV